MNIIIDGYKANTKENYLYRGVGMVTGNNSSRLLLDYKTENPDAYNKILEYIFGEKGLAAAHLKIEMGSDINSSSGTEPAVKRTENEIANVTRGAGYQLAADAKKINPNLTLDMLWWSEPLWITEAENVYEARYKWYKETLDAAYNTYGLKFDYVSATQNERAADNEWIKFLSRSLKAEKDCPYDYSRIKVVAGDEVCTWRAAEDMLNDAELRDAVDVVGSHYTSFSSEEAQKLASDYGKELWFSESSTPMVYAQGTYRYDKTGSGIGGLNGILDIANRFITMYPKGKMTLCEYQPVVSAYYEGVTYSHKQFISACDPWSGYYYLDSGFFMQMHFSQFMKKGWAFIDDACNGDGKIGGDGHALTDSVYSYMTAKDIVTDDYSVVITNTTPDEITYNVTVKNLKKASSEMHIWETRGPNTREGEYNENYFKNIGSLVPIDNCDGTYSYSITVKPDSLVTLSTIKLDYNEAEYKNADESEKTVLPLPYADDFEYKNYASDYLSSRGYAPRYTTDQGGAFEVQTDESGNHYLMQLITPETKAKEWGGTPNPTTNFGDDRWSSYSVSADIKLTESNNADSNYAGVGLRYILAAEGDSGYSFRLFESGKWTLLKGGSEIERGTVSDIEAYKWNRLKIEAEDGRIRGYINGKLITEHNSENESVFNSGRASLSSSYNKNCFDNILVEPIESKETYITRYDNTDRCFTSYEGDIDFETIGSFRSYKRTLFSCRKGSRITFSFDGTGAALTGNTTGDCVIKVTVDGASYGEIKLPEASHRESSYQLRGLKNGNHTVVIEVVSGTLGIDSLEVTESFRKE
ncbi:MAG: glycosyl hydrolase family 59 [Ruminiclostridium sp.]|nr:glycosyl hydrolase family 59 [Ruminiclostridium sp.]